MEDWLEKAFQTAHFILDDRELALRVTGIAAEKLEVAAATQGKRLYYRPKVDTSARTSRSKAVFNEAHLFQRLVLAETEHFEKEFEAGFQDLPEHQERMVVHYVKHLMKATLKRNSFYVTLGFCRLLFNYTTPETMAIYERLAPDEAESKDDPYFRSRKGVLMGEIRDRFGSLIQIVQGAHGERKFKTLTDSTAFSGLVRNALSLFAPWQIPGTELETVRPWEATGSAGSNSEGFSEIERIRTIVHPERNNRFITGLGFAPPNERLEIPHFQLPAMKNPNAQPHGPALPTLSDTELQALKRNLQSRAAMRKSAGPETLSVCVDGAEYARFNPLSSPGVTIDIEDNAETIEVWTENGEIPLATMFLKRDRSGERFVADQASVTLEGGQKISFDCIPKTGGPEFFPQATIHVGYQETSPVRKVGFSFRRAGKAIFAPAEGESRVRPVVALTGLATILIGVTSGAAWLLNYVYSETPQKDPIAKSDPSTTTRPLPSQPLPGLIGKPDFDTSKPDPNPKPESPQKGLLVPSRPVHPRHKPKHTGNQPEGELITRDGNSAMVLELKDVKAIFVKIIGSNSEFNQSLLASFQKEFQGKSRVTISVVQDLAEADAQLEVTIQNNLSEQGSTVEIPLKRRISGTYRLLNTRLNTIWPSPKGGRFSGTAEEVSRQISNDLATSIEKAQAKS